MRLRDIRDLVESTSDCAFAVNGEGVITAWNAASEALFGLSADQALGKPCRDIVQGSDECGMICAEDCTVRQLAEKRHPVRNFDLQVSTVQGRQWCNISVLTAEDDASTSPYSIHIIHPIDSRKRLEMLVRDFVAAETNIGAEQAAALISVTRAPARDLDLSGREIEVLRLMSKGMTSATIAAQLHISRTTVNNHIQHILKKLNVHTRLEAIRRAEHAGLI